MRRLPFTILLLGLALFALSGCGEDSESSSSSGLAAIAPPESPIFIEVTVRPQGELQANIEELAKTVGGIDDLGGKIVSELESSAREDGEPFDYTTEVEPWLGEKAGIFLEGFDGEEAKGLGVAVQTTDADAAQSFLEKQAAVDKDPIDDASYEDVEYKIDRADETVYGIVGDLLVFTEKEQDFKDAVNAANGDSLDDEAAFNEAIDSAAAGSFADIYVNVGMLIEQSGEAIDPSALQALRSAGIDPREAAAVASVVPGSDEIEIEVSGDLGDQEAPSGDASELLESLPGNSFAAFAVSGFGEQLQEALDSLDAEGVPGTIPPNQLKKGVKQLGIDLEGLVDSLQDAGVFATGSSESSLGGALVLTAEGSKATEAVEQAVTLLRSFQVEGVTVLGGKTSGFAIRSPELGSKPLVVAARDGRVAIGYGAPPTLAGLAAPSGRTLADNPAYEEAVAALDGTTITGFADGRGALRLADALVPSSETGFQEAKQYLRHIAFVAIGSGSDGDLATAKLIVGLEK